jgi:hypothetical protein
MSFWIEKYNADIVRVAYMAWMKAGGLFSYHISHADFQAFIDPSNPIGQLLQSHLIAIQSFLTPIGLGIQTGRKSSHFMHGLIRWLDTIHTNIAPGMRPYYEWPIERTEEVREWLLRERALAEY